MTERISLAEAYNNKDVITQIAILKDKLDSIPDADLTNVVLKTGDQVIDGEKTFNDPIVANGGVVFANSGIHVNGTLEVDGDIIQNGSAYETHAEQVFTKNDLIVTREDAVGGIAAGQLSGIRVKKYDGVSDLNLGVDAAGIMRVGDLGSEQPLATRDEEASMTSGALVKWDGVNKKMIAPASNIGDDDHPVKVVGGELVPVTKNVNISDCYNICLKDTSHTQNENNWKNVAFTTLSQNTAPADVAEVSSNTFVTIKKKSLVIVTASLFGNGTYGVSVSVGGNRDQSAIASQSKADVTTIATVNANTVIVAGGYGSFSSPQNYGDGNKLKIAIFPLE